MCAYEKYINNNEFWCSLMTDADRRVLEYGQDLEVGTVFNLEIWSLVRSTQKGRQ